MLGYQYGPKHRVARGQVSRLVDPSPSAALPGMLHLRKSREAEVGPADVALLAFWLAFGKCHHFVSWCLPHLSLRQGSRGCFSARDLLVHVPMIIREVLNTINYIILSHINLFSVARKMTSRENERERIFLATVRCDCRLRGKDKD